MHANLSSHTMRRFIIGCEKSVMQLTTPSRVSYLFVTRRFQAGARHLVVLNRAGLVHGVTAGREKQYRVDSAQLARAVAQLADVCATWDRRLRRIKQIAE